MGLRFPGDALSFFLGCQCHVSHALALLTQQRCPPLQSPWLAFLRHLAAVLSTEPGIAGYVPPAVDIPLPVLLLECALAVSKHTSASEHSNVKTDTSSQP